MASSRKLAAIEEQINVTTDKSLAATRNMKNIAAETQEIGVKTLVKLDEQGEQLERIGDTVETIELEMEYTQHQISYLETCGCCYRCCRQSRVRTKSNINTMASSKTAPPITSQPTARGAQPRGPYIKKVLDNDAREDEIEDNLRETGDILHNLEELAAGIGTELDRQNEFIPKLTDKVEDATGDINAATKRLKKLNK